MQRLVSKSILALHLFVLGAIGGAQAHDLWLERDPEGLWLRYGHLPSGHDGPSLIDYAPEIIQRIACHDAQGHPVSCTPEVTSPLRIDCACAATYVLTSSGYWTKTPYGTQNVPKTEAETPIRSWLSYEGVKRLDAWTDALNKPLTQDLELVPLENPLVKRPGEKLKLLVARGGLPVAGAIVTYDDQPRGQTGQDGRINVRLKHEGFQSLQASLTVPGDGALADDVVHTTTLNFELGKHP
jgi:nickel transport protein